jgi:hypothetical protein
MHVLFFIGRLEQTRNFTDDLHDAIGLTRSVRMMSMKQWLALFTLFVLYLLLGAALFYHIESNLEVERRSKDYKEGREIQGQFIHIHYECVSGFS